MIKTHMKRLLIVSFGFVLVASGCQTSQVSGKSGDRYPAMSSKQLPPQPDNPPVVIVTPPADVSQEFLAISAINGQAVSSHAATMNVHPGDIIQFTASVFLSNDQGYNDEGESAENFVWTASGFANGSCDGSSADCLTVSPFQANDYGVSFYVPYNIGPGQDITVSVTDPSKPDAGGDVIVLHAPRPALPPVIVIAPEQYPCTTFSDDCALNGQGTWVYVDGQRYFAPYINDAGWQPYSHGYWTWTDDNGGGWTWVSYDQWGWYTDHYGYWRHHGVYGWIWNPYSDHVYRPHGVSWFYDGGHVGWYPYNGGYPAGYVWGAEHGFDDGYWNGRQDADFYRPYHPGWYHVRNEDFGQNDVWDHHATDENEDACFHSSWDGHHSEPAYGQWPYAQDRESSRTYVENVTKVNITITKITVTNISIKNNTKIVMMYPQPQHPVAAKYSEIPQQSQRFSNRPIPVGAVVNQEKIVPPTTNGRGIMSPPLVKNGSGQFAPIRTIARTTAEPNGESGIYHVPPPVTRPVSRPQPKPPKLPPAKPPVVTHPGTPPKQVSPPEMPVTPTEPKEPPTNPGKPVTNPDPKPVAHPAPPVAEPKPVAHPAPPVAEPKPVAHPAPPVAEPKPVVRPAPPVAEPKPIVRPAPPKAEPAPPRAAPPKENGGGEVKEAPPEEKPAPTKPKGREEDN
jgi:hypothetical protein